MAEQTPQEPAQTAFRAQTDVVVVPFQVRRGSRAVSDLTLSDVVLLEDGRRRDITGFEAPSKNPSLELVVMFDITDMQRPAIRRSWLDTLHRLSTQCAVQGDGKAEKAHARSKARAEIRWQGNWRQEERDVLKCAGAT